MATKVRIAACDQVALSTIFRMAAIGISLRRPNCVEGSSPDAIRL